MRRLSGSNHVKRVFTPAYLLYLAVLLAAAALAYPLLAPHFRPLTTADMARPDYVDSPDTILRKIDRDGLLHDLRPHAKATHDGIDYATNAAGMRDDHEYAVEKVPGVRRVILLGDSFVFGFGLRLEHTMSHQLASLLEPGQWEILNMGVPAYDTLEEMRFLATRGLAYQPDVLVLMYHPNDALVGIVTELGGPAETEQALDAYYGGTAAPDLRARVEAFLARQGQPLDPSWNTPSLDPRDRRYLYHTLLPAYWSQVQAALDQLAAMAREHGFAVMVGIIPEIDRPWERQPFAPLYAHVHDEMARRGFEVIDLHPVLRHYPNGDLMLWGHDGHTSAYANRIIAHVLAERLRAHRRAQAR